MLLWVAARSMNCSALATMSRSSRYSYLRRRWSCAFAAGYQVPLRWKSQPEAPRRVMSCWISRAAAWGGGAACVVLASSSIDRANGRDFIGTLGAGDVVSLAALAERRGTHVYAARRFVGASLLATFPLIWDPVASKLAPTRGLTGALRQPVVDRRGHFALGAAGDVDAD